MKILYVHHCGSTGGAGNSLLFVLKSLNEMGHEIHIVTQYGEMTNRFKRVTSNVYEIEGVPVEFTAEGFGILRTLFINLKSRLLWKELRKVCSIVNMVQPDLIHLNEIGMFSLAKTLKREFNIPIISHARTVPNRKNGYYIKRFTRMTNVYIDHLICISKSVSNLYPNIKQKSVIYNPLHIDKMNIVNLPSIDYHAEKIKVLFLANFYKQKGVQETLEAAIQLKDDPSIEFIIVGSNTRPNKFFNSFFGIILDVTNTYPNYEKRFNTAMKKLGISNLVLKGQIEDINDEIRNCHLLIAPMHLNGTPRPVFEAGVYGIPSILSLYHKIDDLVENGVNGFVIQERNISELVDKILLLKQDRALLKSMGEAARLKFSKVCDQKFVADQINSIYLKFSK
jgi:glycosyltransferase involved in cell wall biosynthesis